MKVNSAPQGRQAGNQATHLKEGLEVIRTYLRVMKVKNNSDLFSRMAEQENTGN